MPGIRNEAAWGEAVAIWVRGGEWEERRPRAWRRVLATWYPTVLTLNTSSDAT
jgi:hypothetical protein